MKLTEKAHRIPNLKKDLNVELGNDILCAYFTEIKKLSKKNAELEDKLKWKP